MRCCVASLAALIIGVMLVGCTPTPTDKPATRDAVSYDDLVQRYNQRVERIDTIWARAVVDIDFTDAEGDRQWEQGNGHFQFQQPDRVALSIGKFGDLYYWFGCNEERFWLFDLRDEAMIGFIGSAAEDGRTAAAQLGWPGVPRDLIVIAANTPLPDAETLAEQGMTAEASSTSLGTTRIRWFRGTKLVSAMTLVTASLLPSRVEIFDEGTLVIQADVGRYGPLKVSGMGGNFPRIATRYEIRDLVNDVEVRVRLEDQRERVLNETLFNVTELAEQLGIEGIVDLDQPIPDVEP